MPLPDPRTTKLYPNLGPLSQFLLIPSQFLVDSPSYQSSFQPGTRNGNLTFPFRAHAVVLGSAYPPSSRGAPASGLARTGPRATWHGSCLQASNVLALGTLLALASNVPGSPICQLGTAAWSRGLARVVPMRHSTDVDTQREGNTLILIGNGAQPPPLTKFVTTGSYSQGESTRSDRKCQLPPELSWHTLCLSLQETCQDTGRFARLLNETCPGILPCDRLATYVESIT